LWIVSEIYLGPVISRITPVHGVVQRTLGWFLMLVMARLTGRFGRVTVMAAIASSVTRVIRPGRIYALFVGFGYALGGITFDLLCFFSIARNLKGKAEKAYLLGISALSGSIALIPYLLFNLSLLGFEGFLLWVPFYILDSGVISVALSVLGTLTAISLLPRIETWASKIRENEG